MSWKETVRRAEDAAIAGFTDLQSRIRRKMRIYPGDRRYSAARERMMSNDERHDRRRDERTDETYNPSSILDMMARGSATPPEAGTPMADNLTNEPKLEHEQIAMDDFRVDRERRKPKPIVSINGEDVDEHRIEGERAA